VANCSVTELLVDDARVLLGAYNVHDHIVDPLPS
jgi:hypothetical protein